MEMSPLLKDILKLKGRGVISIIGAGGKTSLMFRLARELAESDRSVLTTTTTKIFMPCPEQSPNTIIADSFYELIETLRRELNRFNHLSAGSRQIPACGKLQGFEPGIINELWQAAFFDWIIVEADGAKRRSLKASDLHEPVVPGSTTHLVFVTGLDAIGKPLNDKYVYRAKIFSKNTDLPMGEPVDEQSVAICTALEVKKASILLSSALKFVVLNKADTPDKLKSGRKIAACLEKQNFYSGIVITSLTAMRPIWWLSE